MNNTLENLKDSLNEMIWYGPDIKYRGPTKVYKIERGIKIHTVGRFDNKQAYLSELVWQENPLKVVGNSIEVLYEDLPEELLNKIIRDYFKFINNETNSQ